MNVLPFSVLPFLHSAVERLYRSWWRRRWWYGIVDKNGEEYKDRSISTGQGDDDDDEFCSIGSNR
eukprot:2355147-Ditylum_brightwellii.AAC.1